MQKDEYNRDHRSDRDESDGGKFAGKLRSAFKHAHRHEATDRDGDQHRAQRSPLAKLTPSEPQRQPDKVGNSETDKHRIQNLGRSIPTQRPGNRCGQ